jgi:hypothetical protein
MQIQLVINRKKLLRSAPMHINIKWAVNRQLVDALLLGREVEVDELSFALLTHSCNPVFQHLLRHLLKWLHKSVVRVVLFKLFESFVQVFNLCLDKLPLFVL